MFRYQGHQCVVFSESVLIGGCFKFPNSVVCLIWQALTVLEFLVANGAERVIDELQEHTYQIQVEFLEQWNTFSRFNNMGVRLPLLLLLTVASVWVQTLCDFQYMEASGKDQGINVRKKAQSLVALIKDKDKIREVRQKAAANRDKYAFCEIFLI